MGAAVGYVVGLAAGHVQFDGYPESVIATLNSSPNESIQDEQTTNQFKVNNRTNQFKVNNRTTQFMVNKELSE